MGALKGLQREERPPDLWRMRLDPWNAADERPHFVLIRRGTPGVDPLFFGPMEGREISVDKRTGRLRMGKKVTVAKAETPGSLGPVLDLDEWITAAQWSESRGSAEGSITLQRPLMYGEAEGRFRGRWLNVQAGDLIVCGVRQRTVVENRTRPYTTLWRMRVRGVTSQADEGTIELDIATEDWLYRRNSGDFKFVKSKRRKRGWTADEIARQVCARYRIPYRREEMPRGRHRIEKLIVRDDSPLEVIRQAYEREATATGHKYVMDFRLGRLRVRPLVYPRYAYELGPAIVRAAVERSFRAYATAVSVRGSRKERGKVRKLSSGLIVNERGAARSGFVRRVITDDGDTKAELEAAGRRYLARQFQPKFGVRLSHPSIPMLHVGDALKLYIPEEGITDANGRSVTCFVKALTQTLSAGDFSMEVEVSFIDTFTDERKAASKARREARKRAQKRPKPRKARQRS